MRGTSYYGNLADTYADQGLTPSPDVKAKGGSGQQASQGHHPRMAKSTKCIVFGADQLSIFWLPWLRFSVIFLSCKANTRVYDAKSGHGPHSPPPGAAASPKHLKKVATCSLRLCQSGLRTQTANQAKFIPPIIIAMPTRC